MDDTSRWDVLRPYFSCVERALKDGEMGTAAGMMFSIAEVLFAEGMALTPDEYVALQKGIDGVLNTYLERVKPYPLHFV